MNVEHTIVLAVMLTLIFVATNVLVDYIVLRWIRKLTNRHELALESMQKMNKSMKTLNNNIVNGFEILVKAQENSSTVMMNSLKGLLNKKLGGSEKVIDSQMSAIENSMKGFMGMIKEFEKMKENNYVL